MNDIKFEDLKVKDSKNPIETLLQQTGWSLEEALLRLSDYKSSTYANKGSNSDIKSNVKAEVKEEISDYCKFFMSANKGEEENDSDVEIIEEHTENCEKDDTNVQESVVATIEIIDDSEENLTSKSAVIETNSISDKNENSCEISKDNSRKIDTISISDKGENSSELLKGYTKNFVKIYTKARNNVKVKVKGVKGKCSIRSAAKFVHNKYAFLGKLREQNEIEKAEKEAAVRKKLKMQLELLREKKKPNLKFLCSQPETFDAQNSSKKPSIEHKESLVDGKDLNEKLDVQNLTENPSIEHKGSLVDGKDLNEKLDAQNRTENASIEHKESLVDGKDLNEQLDAQNRTENASIEHKESLVDGKDLNENLDAQNRTENASIEHKESLVDGKDLNENLDAQNRTENASIEHKESLVDGKDLNEKLDAQNRTENASIEHKESLVDGKDLKANSDAKDHTENLSIENNESLADGKDLNEKLDAQHCTENASIEHEESLVDGEDLKENSYAKDHTENLSIEHNESLADGKDLNEKLDAQNLTEKSSVEQNESLVDRKDLNEKSDAQNLTENSSIEDNESLVDVQNATKNPSVEHKENLVNGKDLNEKSDIHNLTENPSIEHNESLVDVQNVTKNPSVEDNESLVNGNELTDAQNLSENSTQNWNKVMDVLETGDSDFMIVDVIGGYESPVREESNYDPENVSNNEGEEEREFENPFDFNENQLPEDGESNNSNQSNATLFLKVCDNIEKILLFENKMDPLDLNKQSSTSNENHFSEDDKSNNSNQSETTSKLKICENIKQSLDYKEGDNQLLEKDESNDGNQNKITSKLKICENIKQSLNRLLEDDESNSSNQSKTTSKVKICENIKQLHDYKEKDNQLLEDEESNSSNQSKITSKLKICDNIKQSLEYEERDNAGANFEPMQRGEARSTGNFLRSLSENIFSKSVVNIITPTKTKDITKIKGWKKKRFVESDEKEPTVSKDSSFIRTQKENVLGNKSAFISEKLDQFLSSAPKSYHTANGIQEGKSSTDYISSSTDPIPSVSTVFAPSNIMEASTSYTSNASTSATLPATSNTSTTATVLTTSPIPTEFISFPDHNNIAHSPTAISTTFSMPTSNSLVQSEKLIDSNTSTVSTIPTVTPIPSVSSADSIANKQTDTIVPSYSTFSETIKPYKPKTLAEKRRLLEESKLPLTANLLHSMNKEQRQTNRSRILNFHNQLFTSEVPFDRDSYKISSDIVNMYSYILCNNKRLKVTSFKKDKVLANIKYRRKPSKPKSPYIPASNETLQLAPIAKKPSLLESLKEPPKHEPFNSSEWETVEMKLPKVSLSVVPQYGQVLHPNLEHLIGNETWLLSENRVKFALSLLRTKNAKSKLHTFKFPLVFPNKQETMKMKRKKSVVDKIEEIKITENDDEIQEGVNSVMYKLLDYVDVLDDIEKLNISNDENVESSIEEPKLTVPTVDRPVRRQAGPRSKVNKTALEMKRLNCKIVSVVNDEESIENENCTKEVCKLGCICKTLRCDSKNLVPLHCGSWKCIFKCSCKNNNKMDKTLLPSGYNLLNAGVINRLQDQAKKNLAKVEKEFTQTIIKTDNQLIMVGDSKERRRRVTKTPKKYNDYLNEDLTDTVESDNHQLSTTDDESFTALPSDCYDVKPCSVPLCKYNFNDIIPFCIVHWMYKCDCMYKSDSANSISIPFVSHCTPVLAPEESDSLKSDIVKKPRKKYTYKIPRPHSSALANGFVKPMKRVKYSRKERDDKTFNKEEFCSRTRGLSTSYYIPRNKMESQLENMLRNSKRFSRDLTRYVRSLRVKLNDMNRNTSKFVDATQAENDEVERDLIRETIERLTPFIRAERHLDDLIARLYQRMNGVVTPETMRRERQLEIQPVNPEVSQDTSENPPSNSLSAIINCYRTNNSDNNGTDQAALLCSSNIQEKYMYTSSKQKEFRLLPWTSLVNNYKKKSIEIWYLNTTKISPILITQRNTRPSVNHCNIRVFEHLPEEASIPLDFIRCVVHNKVPMNKNPDNIFVILSFAPNNCSELYSVCEKSLATDKKKIRVALLQQIKETPSTKDIDIESVAKENKDEVIEQDEAEEILQGEFLHYGQQNERVLLTYRVQKFKPHTFNYESVSSPFFETKKDVRLPLPREPSKCRWRLIHCDQEFLYLRLSCNKFTIKYCDIMKVVQLSRNKRKTVIITSDDIKKGHRHRNFGIFCVPNYVDKIFIGPYFTDEDHHVDIFITKVVRQGMLFETVTIDNTNGLWVNQIDGIQDSGNTESCIDLTKDEDELTTILKNCKCNNLLRILGFSSDSVQNDDHEDATNYDEDATNYEEDVYWNDLYLYMKDVDFAKVHDKADSEILDKIYYSMKNKGAIRYFISNVPGLGYIKAFLHEITNDVDIVCPLTNKIRRFSSYNAAMDGITRILVQNLIVVPLKLGLRVRMLTKLNPTMKTPLSLAVLDGYHMVGDFGMKSVRNANIEELKAVGLTDKEVEFVLMQRRKRLIFDLTNRLAQNFSLGSTSAQRSYGDVLTEITKKIISTIKLSTAGSSIKNIEKAFKLINLFPLSIMEKLYKQLEYIAYNFKKKELSTAELQKIRISPQKRKSVSPKPLITSSCKSTSSITNSGKNKELSTAEVQEISISPQKRKSVSPKPPITSSCKSSNSITNSEKSTFKRIRLYPQIEDPLNLEAQGDSSSTNIVATKELSTSQFQRIRLSKREIPSNSKPDIELKPISSKKDIQFKEIRRSLPNEKFTISKLQGKSNASTNDVIITKLNRLHSFGTTVVANSERKKVNTVEDDVIVIEAEPTTKSKLTSVLRNQQQPELKKRNLQLEDNVVIQPEPKRLKSNVKNDVIIRPQLKNHITQLRNGAIPAAKKSGLQNNIVVARTESAIQKRLQVMLANGNTTSLLKGKYINLLPLKSDGENKYVILANKDKMSTKFKRVSGLQNGKKLLVTPKNGKSLLVPQSTNITLTKLPVKKLNKVTLPKMTPLSDLKSAPQKQSSNLVIGKEKNSSFITIQSGETTKCFKVLNRKMNSVKKVITGQVVRPSHELPK